MIATAGVTFSALDNDPLEQYDVIEDAGLEDGSFKLEALFLDLLEAVSDDLRLEESSGDVAGLLGLLICFCLLEEVIPTAANVSSIALELSMSIASSWILGLVAMAVMAALAVDAAASNTVLAIAAASTLSWLMSGGYASLLSSSSRGLAWLTVDAGQWACDPQAWPFGKICPKYS